MPETSTSKLSKISKGLFGAGIGILLSFAAVTYLPDKIAKWATAEPGKTILFWAQVALFILSIGALITVSSLFAQVFKGIKLTKIKYKDVELNFEQDKKDDTGERT